MHLSASESQHAHNRNRTTSSRLADQVKSSSRGRKEGSITKGVFSPEESPESLRSLDSLESRIFLCFPESRGSLESLNSLASLESRISRKWIFLKRPLFQKTTFSESDPPTRYYQEFEGMAGNGVNSGNSWKLSGDPCGLSGRAPKYRTKGCSRY